MEFAAKVDLWFLLAFYGSAVLMAASVVWRAMPRWTRVMMAILAIVFAAVPTTLVLEVYVVDDGRLYTRGPIWGGPVADIRDIQAVTPTRDSRGSKAASLDRLRVDHRGVVFIAVHDKAGLLRALHEADPELVFDGERLVRRPGRAPATP